MATEIETTAGLVRVWVDFNDRELGGYVPASLRHATGGFPKLGDLVIAYDGDGNTCRARVAVVDREYFELEVDWDSWTDGPAYREPPRYRDVL